MATGILIIAESGAGKSTAIETLDPKETFIINVANKPLPFKGWKTKYTLWHQENNPSGNMYVGASPKAIEGCLKYVSAKRPEVKTIVVDDFQYMSSFEYFDRITDKSFDKWTDLGSNLARIVRLPQTLREDLNIFFLTHAEESLDLEGRRKLKAKTLGNLVDKNLTLEGLFTMVLYGKVKKDKDSNVRYVFETRNSGENTCKTPKGMFADAEIPNSLQLVVDNILEYES